MLVNVSDSSEHVFQLKGVASRPLAQDHITLHAQAKKRCVTEARLDHDSVLIRIPRIAV